MKKSENGAPVYLFQVRQNSVLVRLTRLELAQPCGHYHLKVACIPISPQAHGVIIAYFGRFWVIYEDILCSVF